MKLIDIKEHLIRHKYENLLAFQISVSKDNFLFSSVGAPAELLSDTTNGFSDKTINGVRWRVYSMSDNAIRYSGRGDKVDVILSEDNSGVTLRIADSGPGIPQELREDVFKRFFRGNQSPETGTGLGLSIVKQITDLHHSVISLGESPEKGLQVDIFFPHTTRIRPN